MIGKLSGTLDSHGDGWAIVDVRGVGYLVNASARTIGGLAGVGKPARLLIETRVTDERVVLYGFRDAAERAWFRLLQGVQGVGPRLALAVLGTLAVDDLARAIAAGDRAAVGRTHGVGPKLAQRIVTELKDKIDVALSAPAEAAAQAGGDGADAVSVLVNLGYGRSEAFAAIAGAARTLGTDARVEDLVRAGLRELAR
ncbi:MAG: Holliday junction branch migration protein RuvA [Alphaproteobacteria bacterium]|nr:Holliday junction branch migration protein RuvA [Alphaproteobacteria bacterium]